MSAPAASATSSASGVESPHIFTTSDMRCRLSLARLLTAALLHPPADFVSRGAPSINGRLQAQARRRRSGVGDDRRPAFHTFQRIDLFAKPLDLALQTTRG